MEISPQQRRLASIPLLAYYFLMNSPIWTYFGMKIDIDYQNKIANTLLQKF